jgi:hypothetical protein
MWKFSPIHTTLTGRPRSLTWDIKAPLSTSEKEF